MNLKNASVIGVLLLSSLGCGNSTPEKPAVESPKNLFSPVAMAHSDFIMEYEDTGKILGHSGSHGKVYRSKKNPSKEVYVKEDRWVEAYASVVYRYFLDEHAQDVFFISEGNRIHAGITLQPGYKEALGYHGPVFDPTTWVITGLSQPLLQDRGLGGVIVLSMLLGDYDLKGLASANSNLGIIPAPDGKESYYRIDSEGSFQFDSPAYKAMFDLSTLKHLVAGMEYLKAIRMDTVVTPTHLKEIQNAGVQFSKTSRANLEAVLDFCEKQLAALPSYPSSGLGLGGVFSAPAPTTYKEAILRRFDELVRVLK